MNMKHRLLDLVERAFTHGDAVKVTGIPAQTLNNWTGRGLIDDLGRMNRSGRRMYSVAELISLKVIGDLAIACRVSPSFAAAIAQNTMPRNPLMTLDPAGQMVPRPPPSTDEQGFIMAWVVQSEDRLTTTYVTGAELLKRMESLPHPIIIVPLDVVAYDVMRACLELLDAES